MTTLKQEAMAYEPKETKNIVELEKVPVDIDIKSKTVNEGEDNEFSYKYIDVDDEEYRVPTSVLKQMKQLIANDESVEFIAVSKTGSGLKTEYFVRKA